MLKMPRKYAAILTRGDRMDEAYESEPCRRKARRRRRRMAALLAMCFCCAVAAQPAYAVESGEKVVSTASAAVRSVIPVGHTVGIKLFSDGLLVVNLSESTDGKGNVSPARSCGIKTGDLLLEMNDEDLKSTEQLQAALQKNGDQPVSLTVKRGSKTLSLTTTPVSGSDGVYRLGAWVRDSMAGIGTMTYYNPQTGTFGALGHGITDVDTAQLMPVSSGSLMPSTVAEVKKGEKGTPGELTGEFETTVELGTLQCNSESGVFGKLTDTSLVVGEPVPVACREEVRCGKATILCNVDGDDVEEFSIKITKIMENGEGGRDMMIRVTDERLLSKTGGIVQGMSGSPILQNGKIVGAVTHVLVSDSSRGYAILMETMLANET